MVQFVVVSIDYVAVAKRYRTHVILKMLCMFMFAVVAVLGVVVVIRHLAANGAILINLGLQIHALVLVVHVPIQVMAVEQVRTVSVRVPTARRHRNLVLLDSA